MSLIILQKNYLMKKFIQLLLLCSVFCYSCTNSNEKTDSNENEHKTLEEKTVLNYIKAVNMLETEQRGLLDNLSNGKELNNSQKDVLELLIKKNGFQTVTEFESANRKISRIFLSLQVKKDSDKIKSEKMLKHKITKTEYDLVQKYLQEMAEALQDIKIPVESEIK